MNFGHYVIFHHVFWYIFLYNMALLLNLILDILLSSYLSYTTMAGRGMRTVDGRRLGELKTMQEIFESYPMQKDLGSRLLLRKSIIVGTANSQGPAPDWVGEICVQRKRSFRKVAHSVNL